MLMMYGRLLFDIVFFFFSSRRRHTRFDCDWSSDVCSSDLAGATYAGLLSLSGPPAFLPVSANRILDLGFDALTGLSLSGALPGFTGTLPADGKGIASLAIPNDASLRTLRLFVAMVTLDRKS